MATITYTRTSIAAGNGIVISWSSLSSSSNSLDTGLAFPSSLDYALGGWMFSDKSVHVYKRSSATVDTRVIIEGSNESLLVNQDSLTYATLSDPQGNALHLFPNTSALIEGVLENCMFIRPRITTTSSPNMAVDVHLLLTSTRNARSGM